MKYFMDFEFLEGDVPVKMLGVNVPKWLIKPNNTIQPISVGIVAEDGREYYAISKDFNLKEAWNRYDLKLEKPEDSRQRKLKEYWIRENVLKPIFDEWKLELNNKIVRLNLSISLNKRKFTYKNFKYMLKCIGKTNKQIAEEIKEFVGFSNYYPKNSYMRTKVESTKPEFYGYYSDYDWVVFCWLFGKMIDLPTGFPMYCIDLKQELDNKAIHLMKKMGHEIKSSHYAGNSNYWLDVIKKYHNYPKQINEHNALDDAKWNKKLYEFLKEI